MQQRTGFAATVGWTIAAAALTVPAGAAGASYPDHVVQIVVPTTAGSSADILGRVLADGFSSRLGKPFIVVDRPGASGVLGTADVARAKPDGYTLMHGATYSITVEPLTDKQAGYTLKSFTPICQTFKNDQVVVVPPNSPLKTARDLIEAARRKPGAVTVGIPGIATIPHLAMIELADQAKVSFNDIPFKGPAEEIENVRSGQIDFAAVPLTAAAGSGLPMPGIFAEERNPSLPNVPTFKEQGYDVAPLSYGGLLGPAGMPDAVVRTLEAACIAVMKSGAAQRVVKHTFQPTGYSADAAGFSRNLAIDAAEKNRLVPLLHPQ
ncbi:MAG: tripartite tricarboxylate transporter substrate binding protein [Xanthobacteraceae bacterium]